MRPICIGGPDPDRIGRCAAGSRKTANDAEYMTVGRPFGGSLRAG